MIKKVITKFIFVLLICCFAISLANENKQKVYQLMTEYYQVKNKDPKRAKALLKEVITLDPTNVQSAKEMAYYALKHEDKKSAQHYFSKAIKLDPSDLTLQLQLGYLLNSSGNYSAAREQFVNVLKKTKDIKIKKQCEKAIAVIDAQIKSQQQSKKPTKKQQPVKKIPQEQAMLNQFYQLKRKNKSAAQQFLYRFLAKYPNNARAQKEMGYMLLEQGKRKEALPHFLMAFKQEPQDPELAAQIGYIYNGIGNNKAAYPYFQYAYYQGNQQRVITSYAALQNLAAYRFAVFPYPWFGEFYFAPFYMSRFGTTIFPLQARFGWQLNHKHQFDIYIVHRFTRDTRSIGGISPAIFEDNVAITGVGFRFTPIPSIPVVFFLEDGAAYDLIFRNRNRWRNDLRGGLLAYQYWGSLPMYNTESIIFPLKWYADFYGELIYYSRFDNNVIGLLRFRPGIRILQSHHLTLNIYFNGKLIFDTRREFFNNLIEFGPALAIIPDNRLNLVLRYEFLRGVFIKTNSPSVNPFGPNYIDQRAMAEFFIRI